MSHPESTATRDAAAPAQPPAPAPAPNESPSVVSRSVVKGGFRFTLVDSRWWWSSGMYMLLGIRTEHISRYQPSTRLLLTHLDPDGRRSAAQAWTHLRSGQGPVAFTSRIVGLDKVIRPVFVTASADGHRSVTVVSGVIQWEAAVWPVQRSAR